MCNLHKKLKKGDKEMNVKFKKLMSVLLATVLMVLSVCTYTDTTAMAAGNTITIHYKSTWSGANIYYWNQGDGCNNPVKWPGQSMNEEEDGWYVYSFENTSDIEFMFNYGGKQTLYFEKTPGEYWYADGQWYERIPEEEVITPTANPTATKAPEATATKAPEATATKAPEATATPIPEATATPVPEATATPVPEATATPVLEATATPVPEATATPVPEATATPVPEATATPVPEATATKAPEATATPVPEATATKAPEATATPVPEATATPVPEATATKAPEATATPIPEATATPTLEPTVSVVTPELSKVPTATDVPSATPTQGPTPTPRPLVKGKIIIHAQMNTIYYWGINGDESVKPVPWPGVAMTDEGNDWYTFTIEDATSSSIIFSNGGSGQTADLTVEEGEWWYKGGKWYDYDLTAVTPTPKPTRKPTVTKGPTATPVPYDRTDFRDDTIYFVMTTRFYDGDPSNNVHCWDDTQAKNPDDDPAWRGDFKGLIERLDYIKALGFTAIWITPVVENTSGYDYHGYHASDFSKVDPRYESDDCTYQDLINACHEKGMKIIQDVVFNHTGNFGEANLIPMFEKVGDLGSVDCLQIRPDSDLPENYNELLPGLQYQARLALLKNTDGENHDSQNIYHHYGNFNWDEYDSQLAQIAGDCVDLNTENPLVYNYLIDCYTQYINMGVDGFRVDTTKHISRLTFNETFNPAFMKAGGENFFMFGEVCARDRNVWYRNTPGLSTPFYTWAETKDYGWSDDPADALKNVELTETHFNDNRDISAQPTSDNALLRGNEYHTPDYSQYSGLSVIDFPMHWNFNSAHDAWGVAIGGDKYYNDATWNVTYVDSHDYAPDTAPENQRFAGSQETWAENLNLMFTFRGIPCIYYGSEIEFMKGAPIDVGPNAPLSTTGRAYFGDYLEGEVTATDFGEYTASGAVAETLNYDLAKHIQKLNKIRAAVPALRKGQYSTEGVSGGMAFKRRYTGEGEDSFVCVAITGGATFTGIPNGTYIDAVTGASKTVSNGTLTIEATGKGNMRVYVLDGLATKAPGKVGEAGKYLK